ncbi:MAG TPA: DmsC/YnfH family molybdoenzyme membrane anchor subunit, partial [Geminicoccaceae bacterium]|nr:DmsC/YnfH family molybdoenzyme membrane anchor subunit [Geminicoccaceae bacterium]
RWIGFWGLGLGLVLVTVGLAASTLHRRRPERAWRAFSQWRSSWLSREGVLAVLTYLPALALFLGWVVYQKVWPLAALLTAAGAVATVICTAMIYASLKPIARWHTPWVPVSFLALALASGSLLAAAVATAFGPRLPALILLAALAALAAWLTKLAYWHETDAARGPATIGTATGLEAFGRVRLLEPPHTAGNYLTHELGFRIARKHATRLRGLALCLGALVPLTAAVLALAAEPGWLKVLLAFLAAAAGLAGALIERWLFFAEARHTAMLYYGAETA